MTAPKVLAHRGARRIAPENTIEAFVRARALGAEGVELDVHRSRDGALVVHHDAAAPGLGVFAHHVLDEIRAARPDVPTLDEALDTCLGMLVNVEVKNLPGDADYDPDDGAATALVELLARRARIDDVLVSSFNLQSIDRVRALDPTLSTGLLTIRGFDPLDAVVLAEQHGHRALHPDVRSLGGRVAGEVVARARALEVEVNVWTVNDTTEITRLAGEGVTAIITDVPDAALVALGR